FAENVFDGSNFGPDIITKQTELLKSLPNPVLAYCTSGARSSVVWAFVNTGIIQVDKILDTLSEAGYQLDHLRPQLEQLALTRAMG
ncbi:MAG: TIGR01244 family phosphatase, partial [Planktomarina sp.]|nr:TIGR01244 family phosphatase [Planktomarina sp.]